MVNELIRRKRNEYTTPYRVGARGYATAYEAADAALDCAVYSSAAVGRRSVICDDRLGGLVVGYYEMVGMGMGGLRRRLRRVWQLPGSVPTNAEKRTE